MCNARAERLVGRWAPLAAIVALPLLLLWRALFAGEAFFWGTPLLQFVPWQEMAAQIWRSGHLPLWNPLVGCGAPLAANYQTGAFYPLNALHLILPAEVALSWTTALHVALAGWGMYRWVRAIGLDRFPATIGALTLEGSAFLVARVGLFPSMALTFPWVAIWLWRAELLVRRADLWKALWLGSAVGLGLLAGHAQTATYGLALLLAYLVFRMAVARTWRSAPRVAGYAGLAVVLGAGLAAVQLLPTAELMRLSQRAGGIDERVGLTYSFWPWRLITFLAPNFFGNPGQGGFWGYATYWEDAGYVGVLPLLLAFRAVLTRRRGDRPGLILFWLVAAGVGIVLALGSNSPLFMFLFRHVPGFDLFRSPARWLLVTTIALAALAALGAARWPRARSRDRWAGLSVVLGLAFVIAAQAASRLVAGMPETFAPATTRLGLTLIVTGGVMRLAWAVPWWRAAVIALVALDLLLFGWPLVPTVDRSLYAGTTDAPIILKDAPGSVPPRVYWPTDPAHADRAFDAQQRIKFDYLRFDDFGPHRAQYWRQLRQAMLPNATMLDDVYLVNNFDPLLVSRYVDLLERIVEQPSLLRVMGATHVMTDRDWPGGVPARRQPAVGALYRLPDGLGRAWVVADARYVPADRMLGALADPAFVPGAEVLLEQPVDETSSEAEAGASKLILRDAPNRVTIRAVMNAPGILVVADTWYPGWEVTVDGQPAPLLRANHNFRAVALEAGEHVVEMVYRPASVRIGAAVTLATLAALGGAGWLAVRKRRKRRETYA